MAAKKKTPAQALEAMREADLDDLVDRIEAMSAEEVDRTLDENGGDAAGTAKRGLAQIAAIQERSARLSWQDEARAKLHAGRTAFATVRAKRPKLPRAELVARITAAQSDTRFAAPIMTFFRKRTTAETTDAELEALLDEIEAARALEEGGGNGEDKGR